MYDDNYQIQQYHEEIRNHYAQQNPDYQMYSQQQQHDVQIATTSGKYVVTMETVAKKKSR